MSNDTSGHPEVNDESPVRPWAVLISTSKLNDVSQCQCITLEFFRNTQSCQSWHFCTTSIGNKFETVES